MKYIKKYSVFEISSYQKVIEKIPNINDIIDEIKKISSNNKGFDFDVRMRDDIIIYVSKLDEGLFLFEDISPIILDILFYTQSEGFEETIDIIKNQFRNKGKIIDGKLYYGTGSKGREVYLDECNYKITNLVVNLKK